jgi:regulatory protein
MGLSRTRKSADPVQPRDVGAAESAALSLLTRRDYASGELIGRLREKGYDPDVIDGVVALLTQSGTLNDARFAENYVSYHAARGQGPVRIGADLKALKLSGEVISAALDQAGDWAARALTVRQRKFGRAVPESWRDKTRQARFLQYRGFSSDHIRAALGADFNGDADT